MRSAMDPSSRELNSRGLKLKINKRNAKHHKDRMKKRSAMKMSARPGTENPVFFDFDPKKLKMASDLRVTSKGVSPVFLKSMASDSNDTPDYKNKKLLTYQNDQEFDLDFDNISPQKGKIYLKKSRKKHKKHKKHKRNKSRNNSDQMFNFEQYPTNFQVKNDKFSAIVDNFNKKQSRYGSNQSMG